MPLPCPREDGRLVEPIAIPYITPNHSGWFDVCPCGFVFAKRKPRTYPASLARDEERLIHIESVDCPQD